MAARRDIHLKGVKILYSREVLCKPLIWNTYFRFNRIWQKISVGILYTIGALRWPGETYPLEINRLSILARILLVITCRPFPGVFWRSLGIRIGWFAVQGGTIAMNKLVLISRRTFVWAGGLLAALTVTHPALASPPPLEVPEPSTLGLVAAGAVAAAWLVRRNRKK